MDATFRSVIIPFAKRDTLATSLQQCARAFQIAPEFLAAAFSADLKETLVLPSSDGQVRLFLLGLGENPSPADLYLAFRNLSYTQRTRLTPDTELDFASGNAADLPNATELAVAGLMAGTYDLGRFKTGDKSPHPLSEGNIRTTDEAATLRAMQLAAVTADICALVDAPANHKTAEKLADWALQGSAKYGFKASAFVGRDMLEGLDLHALLAVNRGSTEPPAFIVIKYRPDQATADQKLPKVALVGKGVTFDTGGISLKDSNNMHLMKSDMGGAAAVLGTVALAALQQWPLDITAIVPATDNCIGSDATKPSEVFSSYSGKTIEMIDTDAEGRLVLADGLSWAVRNAKPDLIIDLATLTGSVVRTFGYHCAGLFTQNKQLALALEEAGEVSGELVWRLPMWDLYKDEIASDVADLRNLSGKPTAGAISAAKFLEVFTEGHPAWAHLDIAGTAFQALEYSPNGRAATGYGVRLLAEFLNRHLHKVL